MAQLYITAHARADLKDIYSYISKDKPEAAKRFVKRFHDKAMDLAENPGMGKNRGEDLRPDLFSFPVGQYVLFYLQQSKHIVLVRVIHGSRDLPSIFSRP